MLGSFTQQSLMMLNWKNCSTPPLLLVAKFSPKPSQSILKVLTKLAYFFLTKLAPMATIFSPIFRALLASASMFSQKTLFRNSTLKFTGKSKEITRASKKEIPQITKWPSFRVKRSKCLFCPVNLGANLVIRFFSNFEHFLMFHVTENTNLPAYSLIVFQ